MSETIFEKIIKKEIPADIVFENESVLAFKDIQPQARHHILFIHKKKSKDLNEMMEVSPDLIKELMLAIVEYTKKIGIDQSGYRLVTNIGVGGGQSVLYTHFHVLAGESFGHFGKV